MNLAKVADQLVEWLRSEVGTAGCSGLVLALSGGVDSATIAILSRRAFRGEHLALIMPIHSEARDRDDARLMVEHAHLNHREVSLEPVFAAFLTALGEDSYDPQRADLPVNNVKPRLRMAALYYYAARLDYLVVGSGNRSELSVGYFTKHGDGGVDLLPLGHLVKTEVRELAAHLGVPRSIIEKPPSAGLWKGQTDEGELGFSYEELDRYLVEGVGSEELSRKVDHLRRSNAHKLRIPKLPPPTVLG